MLMKKKVHITSDEEGVGEINGIVHAILVRIASTKKQVSANIYRYHFG